MASEFLVKLFQEIYIAQNISELDWLVEKVRKLDPTTILEIGVESGGTLKVWEQILPQSKGSLLIGIDISPNLIWDINKSNISIHILKGNSHDPLIEDKVLEILNGRKLDFIYIDAEHTSNAAKLDFEIFSKFVRPGGSIGFHDTNDIKTFLDSLPQDKIEIFRKQYPFEQYGQHATIGTGIYSQ